MFIKYSPLAAIFFGSFLVFAFAGCQKLQDYLYTNGHTGYKECNIKKEVSISGKDTTTYIVSYNAAGNPVSVVNNSVFTGNPNYAFYYDNRNRLVRMVKPYTNGLYDEWDEYQHTSLAIDILMLYVAVLRCNQSAILQPLSVLQQGC